MTVRAERTRKFSKNQLSACEARLKFSFLQENVTLRRAPGLMIFVKFVRCELVLARNGVASDTAPDKSQMRAPKPPKSATKISTYNLYDNARKARPKNCEKSIKCVGGARPKFTFSVTFLTFLNSVAFSFYFYYYFFLFFCD